MRKKCAWDQVPDENKKRVKFEYHKNSNTLSFTDCHWGTDSKTNKQKIHFNQRLLFSWNINSQTFKSAFMFFLCCRHYPYLETLAIEQTVWVNACEPTLMKKIIYNIWRITWLLPSCAIWRNCIQPAQAQYTLLSQRNLSVITCLLCSAWSYVSEVCKRSVNVLAPNLEKKNKTFLMKLFPWKVKQSLFVCLFVCFQVSGVFPGSLYVK